MGYHVSFSPKPYLHASLCILRTESLETSWQSQSPRVPLRCVCIISLFYCCFLFPAETMGLGVLQPPNGQHAPGTDVILDQGAANLTIRSDLLKHGSGRNAHILLVPQPSDDPNDPLNWSMMKKSIVFSIILMGTGIICVVPAPMLNAGIVQVSMDLGRSLPDIAKMNGSMLLAMGAVSPFASAFARKYGKRPVFVVSSMLGLIGCLVGEFAKSYNTLVAGRVLQGFGASAYESLCTSVIGDIYFVHQRGRYVAFVVFFLSSLSNGVSILAGLITTRLGWPFNFHILLPFVVLQTILVVLSVPETAYNRASQLSTAPTDLQKGAQTTHVENTESKTVAQSDVVQGTNHASVNTRPKSFWQELAIYNGTFTDRSLISMVLASILIVLNLIASYNVFVSGLVMAWFVAMSVLSGVMFASPPWNFDAADVGYVSVGPLVGGCLATVFLALVSDPLIKAMTKRNRGIYEPEFRLVLALLGGILSVAGLVGFGHLIEQRYSIYAISTIWGLTLFGMSIVASSTMGYALDAQPAYAVEIFIMNITFKNFFFYGLTNFIVDWYMKGGAAQLFDCIAGITAFLVLVTAPMYVFGFDASIERFE
ncbi:major facilitator superfamily domain-containing protein [Xylariales sp. AK1849]|nr:major facilitator superfamily domain-containing protein [Xylariales sp. AK1849]